MNALPLLILTFASIGASETVLLDFHAPWCGPCRQMTPIIDQLAADGYSVRKVDVQEDGDTAKRLGVKSVPCFIMLVNGREVDRVEGATTRDRLVEMLAKAPGASPHRSSGPRTFAVDENSGWRHEAYRIPSSNSGPLNLYAKGASSRTPPPPPKPSLTLEQRLLAATARLRVNDPVGHSFGTGTIVEASNGEALILTCAHIFRDSGGKGRIAVDLFCEGQPRGLLGKLISYDMEHDVALVAVRPGVPVTPVRVAPGGYNPRAGDRVISIGCSRGADPTIEKSYVTDTDRVLSPPTIQVARQPVVGRSGGGLFSSDGMVIGVCYAADPQDNKGLYAALASLHGELDRGGLSFVYQQPRRNESVESRLVNTRPPEMPRQLPANPAATAAAVTERTTARPDPSPGAVESGVILTPSEYVALTNEERAALWALNSGSGSLTCVVRVPGQTGAKEEIVLKNVSPRFLQHLMQQGLEADPQQLTSERIQPPQALPRGKPWIGGTSHEVRRIDSSGWSSTRDVAE